MTEERKRHLAILGVIITVASFYVRNAAAYPAVQRILAPGHASARVALESLQAKGSLSAGQPDFEALAAFVEARLAELNPNVPRESIILKSLETTGGGIGFGTSSSRQFVGLKMTFFNQKEPVQGDLFELRDHLDRDLQGRFLLWGNVLLWIGAAISIRAALAPSRKPTPEPAPPPSAPKGEKDEAA